MASVCRSLRCLTSALAQAGRGGLLFRFASSVQSCCGKGGALQTDIAVCGEHSPCSGHTGFAPHRVSVLSPSTLIRLPAALYGARPALSVVPVFRSSTKARIRLSLRVVSSAASAVQAARGLAPSPQMRCAFSLRGERPGQPEAWVTSPRVRWAFSLCGPSAHLQLRLRKSSDRNRGLFAGWEEVASLGLSLPLSPPRCLLPPAGMGQLFSGVS